MTGIINGRGSRGERTRNLLPAARSSILTTRAHLCRARSMARSIARPIAAVHAHGARQRGCLPRCDRGSLALFTARRFRLDFETRGSVLVNDDVGTSVLLVSIDTLRADRLSVYGYPRTTDALFEKLAKDSVVFEKVLSPASWTLPAHASLLTGKLPGRHGARFVGLPDGRHRGQCRLPPPQPRHGPGVRAL